MPTSADDLSSAIAEIPALDVHTHLSGGKLAARGLHDIILYHMVVSDLYAAGCPQGARLSEFPKWPDQAEAHQRLEAAIPFLPKIANTSCWWGARMILEDLYGWREPITMQNWRKLDALIRERAHDRAWQREILDRAKIVGTTAEHCRRDQGQDDDRLSYSVEWGMFMRTQWGEYDTALYDLERAWGGKVTDGPCMIGEARQANAKRIRGLADVHAAMDHYIDGMPYGQVLSMATGISTDIDYTLPTDSEMEAAIARRDQAGPRERDIYAAYIGEKMLAGLERHGHEIAFQFALAAEPLPHETMSRISQRTLGQVAELIARHPRLKFQCFLGSRHANQTLCTMARELPNLSQMGFWCTFLPGAIRQVMEERLDMLPANKQCGFFSDAYCVEWSYAKSQIVRKMMADVYGAKVRSGQYSRDTALATARAVLLESPQSLCGMRPRVGDLAKGAQAR